METKADYYQRCHSFREAVKEVSRSLVSLGPHDDMLQIVADQVCRVLKTRWVTFIIFDHENQLVEDIILGGEFTNEINADNFTYEEAMNGLSGWVIENRTTALSSKGVRDLRESHEVRLRRAMNDCGALIVAPLLHEEEVYGTLTVINRSDESDFDEVDADYVTVLADLASAALVNRQAAQRMERLNRQKDLLMREAAHRIKNNFNMATGIIQIQAGFAACDETRDVLKVVESRIRAFSAINELLDYSDNKKTLEGSTFLDAIISGLKDSYKDILEARGIHLKSSVEPGEIPFDDALSLGLLLNEWLANAVKYGFSEESSEAEDSPLIEVVFRRGAPCELIVKDNGRGMPSLETIDRSRSIGLSVIEGMAANLKGSLAMDNRKGTLWRVRFYPRWAASVTGGDSPWIDQSRQVCSSLDREYS